MHHLPAAAARRNAAAPAPATSCHFWRCQRQPNALPWIKGLWYEAVGNVWSQQGQQRSGLTLAGDEVLRVAAPAGMAAAASCMVGHPLTTCIDAMQPARGELPMHSKVIELAVSAMNKMLQYFYF
jgi:hypothetical protein